MFYRSFSSCAAIMLAASSVSALQIQLFETAPLTTQQRNAFDIAADRWERTFSDPITVKVNIGFANLSSGVLGSTMTQRTSHPYSTVRTAMFNDASFGVEKTLVNNLPLSSLPVRDVNVALRNDSVVTMATANAKALGLGTGLDPLYGGALPNGADGQIMFANAFASDFDYDPTNGISSGLTDFVGVATHEIGHLLGFFSMTDVQDNPPNSNFLLHPNTLDVWRFNQTGAPHAVGSETRRLTAGPAEYYDGGLNNRQVSRGSFDSSADPVCGTSSGFCQASHWRDDLGNLMDPTIAKGVAVTTQANDTRALDYVGYNQSLVFARHFPREILYGWFKWPDFGPPDPGPYIPDFGGAFDEFAPPPDFDTFKPPFEPDFAVRVGMDFGVDGMEKRGGLGAVQFQDERPNKDPVIEGIEGSKGEQNLEPERIPFDMIPPVIKDLFIASDVKGKPFSARAVLSELGAELDPSLGRFGGYRIPIALDGEGDDVRGDVDGVATLIMLATDKGGIPDPERENLFVIDERSLENSLVVYDARALGVPEPPLLGDINGDGNVDGLDVDRFVALVLKGNFFVAADMNQDGQVNGLDVDPFVAAVLASGTASVPEPSTLLLAAVAALIGLFARTRSARSAQVF